MTELAPAANAPETSWATTARSAQRPLEGKFALVTGSSRGIGRGIALRLAECGASVAVNCFENEAAGCDTAAMVRDRGADAIVIRADVSRPEELARLVGEVHEHVERAE